MSTIYVDDSVARDPELADRLGHLTEAGHSLVLIAAADGPAAAGLVPWLHRLGSVPAGSHVGDWYLTADPATCGDRIPGLHTILIGPRLDEPRPTRCDSTARDLRDAVLQILGADAMG